VIEFVDAIKEWLNVNHVKKIEWYGPVAEAIRTRISNEEELSQIQKPSEFLADVNLVKTRVNVKSLYSSTKHVCIDYNFSKSEPTLTKGEVLPPPPTMPQTPSRGTIKHGLRDSGGRTEYAGGALKEPSTIDKGRFDLLPPHALHRLARHFAAGASKYGARNWEKGIPLWRFLDSALRHMNMYLEGDREEDHLAAVLWNVGCYMQTEKWIDEGKLSDELRKEESKEEEWKQ